MAITKNWDIHGTEGHWNASVKPKDVGSQRMTLTLSHDGVGGGPVYRDFRGDNDRSIKSTILTADLGKPEELRELAALMISLAEAVDEERA